jgi:hypothetical protein
MSVILLISSGVYELTGVAYIDSIGTLGLAWFAFREGRECFEKANSEKYCGCKSCETGDVTDSLFSGIQANIESD